MSSTSKLIYPPSSKAKLASPKGKSGRRAIWYVDMATNNAWEFAMAFDMKARFRFLVHREENSYTGVFVEWHAKSYLAIKAVECHMGPYVGVYLTKGLLGKACTPEHIFDFISAGGRSGLLA